MRKVMLGLGSVLLLAISLIAVIRFFSESALAPSVSSDGIRSQASQALPPGSNAASAKTSHANTKPQAKAVSRDMLIRKLKERFGDGLQLEFDPDGHLVSIRGSVAGRRAGTSFRPEDPQKAIARAKEVLDLSQELLGLEPDWALGTPISRGNTASAQVYFHQSQEEIAISPEGEIRVDLGSEGQLLSLYSNYVPGVQVSNSRSLTPDQSKAYALEAASDRGPAPKRADGGYPVIWADRTAATGGTTRGYHAYEYHVHGEKIVIDAATGKVLSRENRRID